MRKPLESQLEQPIEKPKSQLAEVPQESQEESVLDVDDDELPELNLTEADMIKAQKRFFGKDFQKVNAKGYLEARAGIAPFSPLPKPSVTIDDPFCREHAKQLEELSQKYPICEWHFGSAAFDNDRSLQLQVSESIASLESC